MKSDPGLTESQARRLRVTCQHIDHTLSDIENTLNASSLHPAFPEYIPDLSPAQKNTLMDYIARIRARLIHVLEGQGVPAGEPHIPLSRAVRSRIYSIDIAAEELRPGYMKGFGDVPGTVAVDLEGIAGELQALVVHIEDVLDEKQDRNFPERLRRLQEAGADLDLLARIEQVVTRRGMAEFRGSIAAILDRAEDTRFEIAVFGRVSSGKSSLLNTMLGTDVLPVGVTPVTAVPTRIVHGEKASLAVSFADAPQKISELSALPDYVTEQKNPQNAKHVTRISVMLPSSQLANGISFVDTPGLGSLATSGAAETLAYLPKCDLGVVLIDAGSTLTDEDIRIVLALREAAIPAHILLSKADLLEDADGEKTLAYIHQHILSETNLDLPVHPVSARPSHRHLLDHWFDEEILSLYGHSQELRMASLQRKTGMLRESVVTALERKARPVHAESENASGQRQAVEARLLMATGSIAQTKKTCGKAADETGRNPAEIYRLVAIRMCENAKQQPGCRKDPAGIVRNTIHGVVQDRTAKLQGIIGALASDLQDDLIHCAEELGIPDIPAPDEFSSLVREMPVFDFTRIVVPSKSPVFASMLGEKYERNRLEQNLICEMGASLEPALAGYARVLREWAERTIMLLASTFENYAEHYRADAEYATGRGDLSTEDLQALREDLALLGARSS